MKRVFSIALALILGGGAAAHTGQDLPLESTPETCPQAVAVPKAAAALNRYFPLHGVPTGRNVNRKRSELTAEEAEEAWLYKTISRKRNDPDFLKHLDEPVRDAVSGNDSGKRILQIIDSAKRFAAFYYKNGRALPLSRKDSSEENAMYHLMYRNAEDPVFLRNLPGEVRDAVMLWHLTKRELEFLSPELSAARLEVFYRTHRKRLPESTSDDAEERKLYARMNYWCDNLEFLEALPLEISLKVIEWRNTQRKQPTATLEEVAQQLNRFFAIHGDLPKLLERPGKVLNEKETEENNLFKLVRYRANNPAFIALLEYSVAVAVIRWQQTGRESGPEAAATRFMIYWEAHRLPPPDEAAARKQGGPEWDLVTLVRKHCEEIRFLNLLSLEAWEAVTKWCQQPSKEP
ncbi:hypothetical protein K2X33_15595 [bacterium]|nr:hypothetical protein [bacterium]